LDNFKYKQINPYASVWEVATDINITVPELNELQWKSGDNNLETGTKRQIIEVYNVPEDEKTPFMKEIEQLTEKQNIIKILQEIFNQNSEIIYRNYPFDRSKYINFSSYLEKQIQVDPYLVKDAEEYELPNHVDNRFTFGNIIINLVSNKSTTSFYKEIDSLEPWYTSPQEQGKGTLFLNTENSVHNIKVTQKEPRYILMVKLLLTNLF